MVSAHYHQSYPENGSDGFHLVKAIPFFLRLASSDPTQIFAFSKKKVMKKAMTQFQNIVTLICNTVNVLSSFFRCSRLSLTTTSIFPSPNVAMLTLQPRLVVSRFRRYYAEVLGLLVPDFFSVFLFFFWLFSFSDRPTQNQETHSTVNEKKGMA